MITRSKKAEKKVLEIAQKFFGNGLDNPDALVITPEIGLARYAVLKHTYDEDPVGNGFMKKPLLKLGKVLDDVVLYMPCDVVGGYKCRLKKDIFFKSGEVKYLQFSMLCEYTSEVHLESYEQIEEMLSTLVPGKRFNVVQTDSEVVIADSEIYPDIKELWAKIYHSVKG